MNENTDIAELLLQINAIRLNVKNYFSWASGWNSPIYCDNRVILSYPKERNTIAHELTQVVKTHFPTPDAIVGVATGAIGIGLLVAEKMQLPFSYVRPEPKKHGRQNQIEGSLRKGQKVVVIEDLVSTGMSSINATNTVNTYGAEVIGMAAIFTYGFDISKKEFKKANIPFESLSNYDKLIKKAIEKNYISAIEEATLEQWRKNPSEWGK